MLEKPKRKYVNHTSKYLRIYGFRIREMADILEMTISTVHAHLRDDEKRAFLLRHLVSRQQNEPVKPANTAVEEEA